MEREHSFEGPSVDPDAGRSGSRSNLDLIVTQGRVGDRDAMTAVGTARTARALEERFGLQGSRVGKPAAPARDHWKHSLVEADATLRSLQARVSAALSAGRCPVIVSSTCGASLASLPEFARRHPEATLCWIDAHGDFNTPDTTETGYIGGMVLSAACGLWNSGHGCGLNPEKVVLIGARDIDLAELTLLEQAGVRTIAPADVTPERVADVVGRGPVWIHIDWDVLEPGAVPADYSVRGGLSPERLGAVLSVLSRHSVVGLELAEYTPAPSDVGQEALSTIIRIVKPLLDPR